MQQKQNALQLAAVASALLLSSTIHAQSSVTLYGFIDEGINFTSNASGHSVWQMVGGNIAGSRFGIKGSEDLGNGYKAVFQIENGFNINSGQLAQESRIFGRQAFFGLSSDRYGTITLGRQYDTSVDTLGFASLTGVLSWGGDVTTHPFDNDNADWDFRVSNAIKYVTPTYHGLTGEAMYAFGNDANSFANNRLWGATLNYHSGELTAAISYLKMNHPGQTTSGAISSGELFDASSQQDVGVAVHYRFPKIAIGVAWSHVDVYGPTGNAWLGNVDLPNEARWNSWKFDNLEVNAQYYFKPNFWLGAVYTFTMAHLSANDSRYVPKWHQLAFMLDYDVSKRTSLYAQAAFQHVVSAHTGTSFDEARIVDASAAASGGVNQMVFRLGIMHTF